MMQSGGAATDVHQQPQDGSIRESLSHDCTQDNVLDELQSIANSISDQGNLHLLSSVRLEQLTCTNLRQAEYIQTLTLKTKHQDFAIGRLRVR